MKKIAKAFYATAALMSTLVMTNNNQVSAQEIGMPTHWNVSEQVWCVTGNPIFPMVPTNCCSKSVTTNPGSSCAYKSKDDCCREITG